MAFQILIVEDSPTQALKLEILLNENRYLTHIAKNGSEGLDMATAQLPDLIISDVTMPVMNGFEMCLRIKSDPVISHIPVLLLTDLHDPADIINGLNAQADAYVTKPYKESFLLSKVEFLLSNHFLIESVSETAPEEPLEIKFSGQTYMIRAGRSQILNLLMSTYENSLLQNTELREKQMTLNLLNEELKKNNSALAASEDRFRSLVLTIPDIVYRIDVNGYFTFINNAIRRLGYEKEDLIGRHFSEILFPDDIECVSRDKVLSKIPKNVRRAPPKLFDERRSGKRITTDLEVRLRSKSGEVAVEGEIESLSDEYIYVEVNSAGVTGINVQSEEKEYVGTVGVIRDISERKKAQAAIERERLFLQTVVDSVPLPIFFKTIHDEYQLTNTAFCDFFHKKTAEIIGYGLFDFLPKQVAEAFHFKEQLFLSNDDTRQIYEMEIPGEKKSIKNIVCHTAKFFSTDQDIQGLIGVLVDVTDQKKIEFELQKSRIAAEQLARRADEANRLKSDFLANMSHEIRTPMNAIIGLNLLAMKTDLTDRQKDYLTKIDQSAQSLLGILNDILDFSKIEAHKLDLETVPFNLYDVLENLTNMFCMKQDEKQIELIFSVDKEVPILLLGDSLRLGQILINLVSNAIKFTDSGEIIISVATNKISDSQTTLSFSVQDAGIGMTEEQVDRLFQPFSQADTSTTRKYGGTGLGLTICKRLVEMMDGKIKVSSVYGEGSTFSFTAKFDLDSNAQPLTIIPEFPDEKHIIVIDDNETSRNIFFYLLTQLNMDVDLFTNGKELIQWIDNEYVNNDLPPIDLVLMDYQMPETNGLKIAAQLKDRLKENHPPVILMDTIYGREEVQDCAGEVIQEVIVKPVPPLILYKAINKVMDLTSCDSSDDTCVTDESCDFQATNFNGVSILLAEDNKINQQVAYEILSNEGIHVTIADNGKIAVDEILKNKKAESNKYDAVFMDIQMPEMDGFIATREINKLYQDENRPFPIIAMTAHAMSGDKDRCLQAGMDDFVSKPIQPEQLFRVLSRWVGQCQPIKVSQKPETTDHSIDPLEAAKEQLHSVNIVDGVDRLGGRLKLYNNILQEFCTTHKEDPSNLLAAIQKEAYIQVYEKAHTIKGVAGNLSAYALLDIAHKIEEYAKNNNKDACLKLIPKLEQAFEDIIDDARLLKQILKNSEKTQTPMPKQKAYENKAALEMVFGKLYKCLRDNDMSATSIFGDIYQRLDHENLNSAMDHLSRSLEKLDFDHAKKIVFSIANKLDINLESS